MPMHLERVPHADPANVERAMKAMVSLGTYLERSGLERSLSELVKIRASQINGCAACLDMHAKDARARGEHEQRLYLLPAWRETPLYSERERAALGWTEALTLVATGHVPEAAAEAVRQAFSDDEVVSLTLLVATINAWNRFNIGLGAVPGTYQPVARHATAAVADRARSMGSTRGCDPSGSSTSFFARPRARRLCDIEPHPER